MQPLIQFFYDYFIDENKDGYLLLCSSVCLQVCNNLYDKFVMDNAEKYKKQFVFTFITY